QLDNALPQSWRASSMYGTPGKLNDVYTKIENESSILPGEFVLYQNYPNPFNPETIISWQLAENSYVTLKIYDILGNEVATLVNEFQQVGSYNYELGIRNYELTSGIYFYQLRVGGSLQTKKMVVLK
ncbi:MAG: T9SS type A sorting domain-containing protein, partial [Ignavibacteria bacterium]|nr:T9SS type A sorting domain-containing protein [Ignavibacteria bacterium]